MATTVSNRDLYEAINGLRKEFGGAISRLDDKFMNLEAGRLTALEKRMNDFVVVQAERDVRIKETQSELSGKAVIVGAIILAILYGVAQAVAVKVIK